MLGPLRVRDGDHELAVPPGKRRGLLGALARQANRAVPVDLLADVMWDGHPPEAAEVTVRNHVRRLRHCLGPGLSGRGITRSPGYLIQLGDEELDVTQFETLARQGDAALARADWPGASRLFGQALALWRGVPLGSVGSPVLRHEHPARLEERRLQAAEGLVEADLHLGRHEQLLLML